MIFPEIEIVFHLYMNLWLCQYLRMDLHFQQQYTPQKFNFCHFLNAEWTSQAMKVDAIYFCDLIPAENELQQISLKQTRCHPSALLYPLFFFG